MLTKRDLIKEIAVSQKLTLTTATRVMDCIIATMQTALVKGDDIWIAGIGTIKVVDVPERNMRNPQTGEAMTVPAHRAVRYSAAKTIKEQINA